MEKLCKSMGITSDPDLLHDADTIFSKRNFIITNPAKDARLDSPLVMRIKVDDGLAKRWHRIGRIWRSMVNPRDTRCGFKHSAKERDKNRSSTSAGHIGMWSHNSPCIHPTKDSTNQVSSVKESLKELCEAINEHISPVILDLQHKYLPKQHALVKW